MWPVRIQDSFPHIQGELAMKRPRFLILAAVALIAVSMASVALSGNGTISYADSVPPPITTADYQVSFPIQLPTGFAMPTGISSSEDGVWFFAQGGSPASPVETIFHYVSSTGVLQSMNVQLPNSTFDAGGLTPIAVSTNNTVWLGLNSNLVKISSANGLQSDVPLPPVSLGGPGLPNLPGTSPGATAPIEAIGFDSSGDIVVVRMFATALQIVNPNTYAVTEIALPSGTAVAGMGNTDFAESPEGGDLAIVLYSSTGTHELGQLIAGSWTVNDAPCPAYSVSFSNGSFTAKGPSCIESGAVGTSSAEVNMTSITAPVIAPYAGCAFQLAGGKTFACLANGVAALGSGGESQIQSLGQVSVAGPIGGSGLGAPAQSSASVQIEPTLTSSITSGTVWFIPSAGAPSVGVIHG
jgi:hypothetical protein